MRWVSVLFIMAFAFSSLSAEACTILWSGKQIQLTYPYSIIVQRDTPVNTVLDSRPVYVQNMSNYATCGAGESQMQYLNWTYAWSATNNIYQTNVPGIGVRVGFSYGGVNVWSYVPGSRSMADPNNLSWYFGDYARWQVDIIKTGTVVAGRVNSGKYANLTQQGIELVSLYSSGVDIVPVACSITTPNLSFPIGNIMGNTFGSAVGTTPAGAQVTQNLGLNCDAFANINVSLSGTQNPDVANNSVLALNGQGSAGVASGVGVQLLYNGTPLQLNNRIVLKSSAGGQETFPLTARYYQTRTAVTLGSANTSATLNLTYQ